MAGRFPTDMLGELFYPDYNNYLQEVDGFPVEMSSLAPIFDYELIESPNGPDLWAHCQKCKLDGHKQQYVFPSIVTPKGYTGSIEPVTLLLLGEGPGVGEDEAGLGYVGAAGRLLFSMLTQMWKDRLPPMMLGNSVLCWPKDNKTPTASWYRNCSGNFWPRILTDSDLIGDNCLIVVTGAVPYKMIHDIADGKPTASTITSAHGSPTELSFAYNGVTRKFPVIPTLHPAAGLHNPDKLPEIIKDFEKVYQTYSRVQNLEEGQSVIQGRMENEIDLDKGINAVVYEKMMSPLEIDILIGALDELYVDMDDKVLSFDVETKSITTSDPTNYIIVAGLGAVQNYTFQFLDTAIGSLGEIFKRLRDKGYKLCGHNLWFDFVMAWKESIYSSVDDLPDHRDTRVMHKLIDENNQDNKLKFLVGKYFGVPDWSMELNVHQDSEGKLDFSKIPMKTLMKYHRGDLYWNLKLYYHLADMCREEEVSGYWKVDYVDFKHTLNKELLQTSLNGMKIDIQVMGDLMHEYDEKMEEIRQWFKQPLYQRIIASLGQMDKEMKKAIAESLCSFPLVEKYDPNKDVFNPNSTQHLSALLAAVLDDKSKLRLVKGLGRKGKTKSGKISLNADNLDKVCEMLSKKDQMLDLGRKYSHLIEGMQKVSEFKKLTKISGTYLDGMVKHTWSDWSVRSQWNVDGAATGRMSSARPNLQQIPRGDTAKGIKRMFVPRTEGWSFMQFDLSQAELRGVGSCAKDPKLKHAYDEGLDLHTYTASNIFHIPMEEVGKHQRSIAKTVNFSVIYGASAPTVSANSGLPVDEAQKVLDGWFEFYSNVGAWMQERSNDVDTQAYTVGLWGLKRRLPAYLSNEADLADLKRQSGNFVVQNFASDFNCFLMILMMQSLKEDGYRDRVSMVNTVHDSIVFEAAPGAESVVAQHYYKAMETMNEWCSELFGKEYYIAMRGDLEMGNNYGELRECTVNPDTYEITVAE